MMSSLTVANPKPNVSASGDIGGAPLYPQAWCLYDTADHREGIGRARLPDTVSSQSEGRTTKASACRASVNTKGHASLRLGSKVDDLQQEVTEMKDKVSYLDIILATKSSVLVTQIARDYGESSIRFNRRLE